MSIKIVTDSSSNLITLPGADFAMAPMKIITDTKEFIEDEVASTAEMTDFLKSYKGKSSTACPSVGDFLAAFGDAKEVICITITSNLSGSYNAACVARDRYIEQYPDRKVFVLDSLSVGPQMQLAAQKALQLSTQGKDFDTICNELKSYYQNTGLMFMLKSVANLVNNGRVSKSAATFASLLGICIVGCASDEGTLNLQKKARGEKKAVKEMYELMKENGYCGGKIIISHCFNEDAAKILCNVVHTEFPIAEIEMTESRLLCGFYGEPGSLIVGFEK